MTAAVLRETEREPASRPAEADRAMAWLRQAVAAGYRKADHLRQDGDFAALRNRADFRRLLDELEGRPSPAAGGKE